MERRFGRGHLESQRHRRITSRLFRPNNPQVRLHEIERRQAAVQGGIPTRLDPHVETTSPLNKETKIPEQHEIASPKINPLEVDNS